MDRELVGKVIDNVFFSKEASEYLGISTQRLNQLVHSEQISPIKKTPAGTLFWKDDLDERLDNKQNIAGDVKSSMKRSRIDLSTAYMKSVLNYYTLQTFFKYSDKKTEPVFNEISKQINVEEDMDVIAETIASYLGNVSSSELINAYKKVYTSFTQLEKGDYIIRRDMKEYPKLLAITNEAPPYLFLRGNISLLKENIVSVVGSRNASSDGIEKANRLSKYLGRAGIVVASGLARGIDTSAHTSSIENKYLTISVLGTPITKVYPRENQQLQKSISEKGLVVSQFPPSAPVQRWHFPMRNAIMSGISLATVIIEAGETSGALKQADYALKQKRLVFIPQSALDNEKISWPNKYLKRAGAMKFSKIDELLDMLKKAEIASTRDSQFSLFSEGAESINVHRVK